MLAAFGPLLALLLLLLTSRYMIRLAMTVRAEQLLQVLDMTDVEESIGFDLSRISQS